MKHVALLLLAIPAALAAQQPAPNPGRLAGDWDFWQGRFVRRPVAYVHLAADSVGGWLKLRNGQQPISFASSSVSGDSVFLVVAGQPVTIAGAIHGDTIVAGIVAAGRQVDRAWLVRRSSPPVYTSLYRLWPGPVSDSAFTISLDTAVPMRTRDGTTLTSFVVRPVGDGPFPVILSRTPYGRRNGYNAGRFFAQRGYIFV